LQLRRRGLDVGGRPLSGGLGALCSLLGGLHIRPRHLTRPRRARRHVLRCAARLGASSDASVGAARRHLAGYERRRAAGSADGGDGGARGACVGGGVACFDERLHRPRRGTLAQAVARGLPNELTAAGEGLRREARGLAQLRRVVGLPLRVRLQQSHLEGEVVLHILLDLRT
jgi:hypothetical protein